MTATFRRPLQVPPILLCSLLLWLAIYSPIGSSWSLPLGIAGQRTQGTIGALQVPKLSPFSSSFSIRRPRPGSFYQSRTYPPFRAIKGFELSDLVYDTTDRAFSAWEWTANLGAPAALVAGAVLVTLSESRQAMQPHKSDKNWIRLAKQWFRFLIMSSFALEVISIFVSTMTGTVLLSHPEQSVAKKMVGYGSPLALLHHHHEFEYLTIQIGFLQGLFNWLAAVALEILIPKDSAGGDYRETKSAQRMNKAMASCLLTLILWIQAFYNHHLSFYSDYASMLWRYGQLFLRRYVLCWPIRPMAFLYIPSAILSLVLVWRAFNLPPAKDED